MNCSATIETINFHQTSTTSSSNINSSSEFARVNFRLECRELKQINGVQLMGANKHATNQSVSRSPANQQKRSKGNVSQSSRTRPTVAHQKQSKLSLCHNSLKPLSPSSDFEQLKTLQFDSMRERLFRLLSKVPIQVETIKRDRPCRRSAKPESSHREFQCSAAAPPSTFDYLREPLVIKYYQDRSLYEILELHFACSLLTNSKADHGGDGEQPLDRRRNPPSGHCNAMATQAPQVIPSDGHMNPCCISMSRTSPTQLHQQQEEEIQASFNGYHNNQHMQTPTVVNSDYHSHQFEWHRNLSTEWTDRVNWNSNQLQRTTATAEFNGHHKPFPNNTSSDGQQKHSSKRASRRHLTCGRQRAAKDTGAPSLPASGQHQLEADFAGGTQAHGYQQACPANHQFHFGQLAHSISDEQYNQQEQQNFNQPYQQHMMPDQVDYWPTNEHAAIAAPQQQAQQYYHPLEAYTIAEAPSAVFASALPPTSIIGNQMIEHNPHLPTQNEGTIYASQDSSAVAARPSGDGPAQLLAVVAATPPMVAPDYQPFNSDYTQASMQLANFFHTDHHLSQPAFNNHHLQEQQHPLVAPSLRHEPAAAP